MLFHQLTPERALPACTPMRIQNRQPKCECEENASQPGRELHKNVRRLRAENVFRDPPPNAAPRPSLFGRCIKITSTMSSATENEKHQRQVDQKVHRGGKYRQRVETNANVRQRSNGSNSNTSSVGGSASGVSFDLVPNLRPAPQDRHHPAVCLAHCSSSSSRLKRATNLSVAVCNALSASSLHFRARLTTANSKSPISSSIDLPILLEAIACFQFAEFFFNFCDHVARVRSSRN